LHVSEKVIGAPLPSSEPGSQERFPKTASERVAMIDRLADLIAKHRAFSECVTEATALFGTLWAGERTDFSGFIRASEWLTRAAARGLGTSIEQALFLANRREIATRLPEKLRGDSDRVRTDVSLSQVLSISTSPSRLATTRPIRSLCRYSRIERDVGSVLGSLCEWTELSRLDAEVRGAGTCDLADRIAVGRLPPSALWKSYDTPAPRHCGRPPSNAIRSCRAPTGNQSPPGQRVQRLEIDRRRAVAALIRARHANTVPQGAMGEMAVIRGEIAASAVTCLYAN